MMRRTRGGWFAPLGRPCAGAPPGSVPASKRGTRCVIGSGDAVTLEWLMRDYLVHMRHHLAQIVASAS